MKVLPPHDHRRQQLGARPPSPSLPQSLFGTLYLPCVSVTLPTSICALDTGPRTFWLSSNILDCAVFLLSVGPCFLNL